MIKKEFDLRDYQLAFKNSIRSSLYKERRIIACSATGSGKTKTFISIADSAQKKGKTVLIISETTRIFKQIADEINCTYINPDNKGLEIILNGHVYLAMTQTLVRRPWLLEQFNLHGGNLLIIADEAHLGTHTNVLMALPEALLIGFTASPIGRHLAEIYRGIVVGPQPHELVLNGYLSPYRHFVRRRADLSRLQIGNNGEYTDSSQESVFEDRRVYEGLIDDLQTFPFKKALIFCGSIKDCDDTVMQLTANGFSCVAVHSKLKREQEKYNWFQYTHGLIPICVGVNSLTKGVDFRPIDFVGLKCKTTSLAKYLQMIGRASRLSPETGKTGFSVFDYGENIIHKPWDWEHDWANIWNKPYNPRGEGVPPVKMCPQCDFVNPVSARVCQNCGYQFTEQDFEEEPETILEEVTYNYTTLVGKLIGDLTPKELSTYGIEKNKKRFAIRVARARAQQDRDFIYQFAREMGYKKSWADRMIDDLPKEPIEFTNIRLR